MAQPLNSPGGAPDAIRLAPGKALAALVELDKALNVVAANRQYADKRPVLYDMQTMVREAMALAETNEDDFYDYVEGLHEGGLRLLAEATAFSIRAFVFFQYLRAVCLAQCNTDLAQDRRNQNLYWEFLPVQTEPKASAVVLLGFLGANEYQAALASAQDRDKEDKRYEERIFDMAYDILKRTPTHIAWMNLFVQAFRPLIHGNLRFYRYLVARVRDFQEPGAGSGLMLSDEALKAGLATQRMTQPEVLALLKEDFLFTLRQAHEEGRLAGFLPYTPRLGALLRAAPHVLAFHVEYDWLAGALETEDVDTFRVMMPHVQLTPAAKDALMQRLSQHGDMRAGMAAAFQAMIELPAAPPTPQPDPFAIDDFSLPPPTPLAIDDFSLPPPTPGGPMSPPPSRPASQQQQQQQEQETQFLFYDLSLGERIDGRLSQDVGYSASQLAFEHEYLDMQDIQELSQHQLQVTRDMRDHLASLTRSPGAAAISLHSHAESLGLIDPSWSALEDLEEAQEKVAATAEKLVERPFGVLFPDKKREAEEAEKRERERERERREAEAREQREQQEREEKEESRRRAEVMRRSIEKSRQERARILREREEQERQQRERERQERQKAADDLRRLADDQRERDREREEGHDRERRQRQWTELREAIAESRRRRLQLADSLLRLTDTLLGTPSNSQAVDEEEEEQPPQQRRPILIDLVSDSDQDEEMPAEPAEVNDHANADPAVLDAEALLQPQQPSQAALQGVEVVAHRMPLNLYLQDVHLRRRARHVLKRLHHAYGRKQVVSVLAIRFLPSHAHLSNYVRSLLGHLEQHIIASATLVLVVMGGPAAHDGSRPGYTPLARSGPAASFYVTPLMRLPRGNRVFYHHLMRRFRDSVQEPGREVIHQQLRLLTHGAAMTVRGPVDEHTRELLTMLASAYGLRLQVLDTV